MTVPTTSYFLAVDGPGPIDRGKSFWEEYLQKVTNEDTRLITRWQKILDTLLVYIGLFIGVLTAFIIQVSSTFQLSSGDETNNMLIAIYNHTMNASLPIDLQQYIALDKRSAMIATFSVFYLYISLAISITTAAIALIINVWLIRYQRSVTEAGPTIHERIRQRHENFTGLMEWRLPIMIEMLPMLALVALGCFAYFISISLFNAYPAAGNTINNTFILVALLFVLTASVAAFIPGAPFHSPLAGFIRLMFQTLPDRSICGLIHTRTVCIALIATGSLAAIMFFPFGPRFRGIKPLLQFLVYVSMISLWQPTQEQKKAQGQSKPPLFSLATWFYFSALVITALSLTIATVPSPTLFFVFSSLRAIACFVMTVYGMKIMSQWTPNDGKAQADAIAWTQPSHNLATFQNAIEIARNSAHLRSSLLKAVLPVLDVVIISIEGGKEQDLREEEKLYVTLLCILMDFKLCEASFWRNEAAVRRPVLSDELKEKLRNLRKGGCATEAEFILDKVGKEFGKESPVV